MKLPRWLVIGLLTSSMLAVLAAPGWWWITWPERTAREFVHLVTQRDFDGIHEMLHSEDFAPYSLEEAIEVMREERADMPINGPLSLRNARTSWSRFLTDSGDFTAQSRPGEHGFSFTATRGRIKFYIGGYAMGIQ
jgi:hypothetical protein